MTKAYSKAIMQRIRFRNKFLKNPTDLNKVLYNKQRNYCVSLLRKEKKECFAKSNEKEITDNRKFWHTVKPFLSDKFKSKETEVAKTFNDFFSNIVKNLEIPEYKCEDDLHNQFSGSPVLQSIMNYRTHLSINTICHFSQHNSSFYFSPVDKNTVLKEIKGLSANKAVQDKISSSKF